MADSRRLREGRQTRDLYVRAGNNRIRTNSPDGYLVTTAPIPWNDVDAQSPGAWWTGTDDAKLAWTGWGMAPVGANMGTWNGPQVGTYGPVGPAGPAVGPRSRTVGSPLTEYDQTGQPSAPFPLLPAITRCVTILTEAVGRTRWLYRDGRGQVIPRPLFVDDPMLLGSAPGPIFPLSPAGRRMTGHGFYTTLLADAILFGQGGMVFIKSSDGTPLPGSLMLLNPFMFGIDRTGHIVLDRFGENPLRTDYNGEFELGGDTWKVAVLHGQYPIHDNWPQGVLLKHFPTFAVGAKLDRYIEGFYDTGIPSGYLSVSTPNFGVEVDDPDNPGEMIYEQDLLKRNWMRAHGKTHRSVAVLNSTVAYTPISVNPVDSDAVKMKSVTRTDVAHAFGMSSVWLDEGMSGLNYSNSSERRADLVSMTAAGWGEKVTNLISSLMPYGTMCEVIWPHFIAPSAETMIPALVQAVSAGIMTGDEARQMLSLTPWTGPSPDYIDTSIASTGIPRSDQAQIEGA